MKLRRAPAVAISALFSITSLAGCATGPSPTDDASEAAGSEAEVSGSCEEPRRYMAVLAEGQCTAVTARRGRWVPSPLFPDAPPESGACFYTWFGEKNVRARVDRAALAKHVGLGGRLTPSCGREGIDDAVVHPIATLPNIGMVGAVGCDVCGLQHDGRLWVVLPGDQYFERQFGITLTNGDELAFQLTAAPGARLMAVTLPSPPAGTEYVNGRVTIY